MVHSIDFETLFFACSLGLRFVDLDEVYELGVGELQPGDHGFEGHALGAFLDEHELARGGEVFVAG